MFIVQSLRRPHATTPTPATNRRGLCQRTGWQPPVQRRLAAVRSELAALRDDEACRTLSMSENRYLQHLVNREGQLLDEQLCA